MRVKYCYITLTTNDEIKYLKFCSASNSGITHKAYFTKKKNEATIFRQGTQADNYIAFIKGMYRDKIKGELGIEPITTKRN